MGTGARPEGSHGPAFGGSDAGPPTVLVSESRGFSTSVADRLRQHCNLRLADLGPGELVDVADVDVLWVRLRHQIDDRVMAAAPSLRAIVTATTGTDHIDLVAARRRNVRVLSLRDHTERLGDVRATAEFTVALILALLRGLPEAVGHSSQGGTDRDLFWGQELYGKSVGVVGYGRLGRRVAHYIRAFDAHVIATDPNVADADIRQDGVEPDSLEGVLRRAEIVTLHAWLDTSTERLISHRELSLMPASAWIVNTARGKILDEDALLEALREGRLAGAALDVLADERGEGSRALVDHARAHPNLMLTPHIGGATVQSREKTENLMAELLIGFLSAPGKTA